jgi:hypothetical protein
MVLHTDSTGCAAFDSSAMPHNGTPTQVLNAFSMIAEASLGFFNNSLSCRMSAFRHYPTVCSRGMISEQQAFQVLRLDVFGR